MINFRTIKVEDKTLYSKHTVGDRLSGCEMSFANLFLWGDQKIAFIHDCLAFFSTFSRSFYPMPMGKGDKKKVIDEIILDAKERNIPLTISSISQKDKEFLEENYPNKFDFISKEGSFDYVYAIDDLADLAGKKYHKKRNHLAQFKKACPEYKVENINIDNIHKVKEMVDKWYMEKQKSDPENDFGYERDFFDRAMANYFELNLEGLMITCGGEVVAVTFASQMEEDTFDVHFEKAFSDVAGAYVVINNEFAKYIRNKYPKIKFLDREEDMGIEGLRKAKQSYYPVSQIIKYVANCKV